MLNVAGVSLLQLSGVLTRIWFYESFRVVSSYSQNLGMAIIEFVEYSIVFFFFSFFRTTFD